MTPRDARLILGQERGTPFEQHLIAAIRVAAWPDLQRLASGWPDLIAVYLLNIDHPDQVNDLARRK